jgi:hypothetical protein
MPAFEGRIVAGGPQGRWACVELPFHAPALFGTRSRSRVQGTINGRALESWVFPSSDGAFFLLVPRECRLAAGLSIGDRVSVAIELATARGFEGDLPEALDRALRAIAGGRGRFEALPADVRRRAAETIRTAQRHGDGAARAEEVVSELLHLVQ